ncbi:MAG: ABC transporter substrate-binding protein [Lachnospiraceae bacterium]
MKRKDLMKKAALVIALGASASLALSGCASSGSSTASSSSAESTEDSGLYEVSIGITPWPANEFFYLAQEEGIFEKNGLSVNVQDFSSTTDSSNAFIGGQLDFDIMPASESISPFEDGQDFDVVMEIDKSNGCEGLVAQNGINSIEDLKGKTVVTQLYSVDHMLLLLMLDQAGMSGDDINLVDMTIAEAGSAFIAGQCDAACIWDPYFSQAKAAGGTVLFSSADNPDLITDILAVNQDLANDHPEVVEAMVRSYLEAVEYWQENTDSATEFMAEKMGVDADEFTSEIGGLLIPTLEDNQEAFTKADDYSYWGYTQNTVRDFMYQEGALTSADRDCADMINRTFIDDIAKEEQ